MCARWATTLCLLLGAFGPIFRATSAIEHAHEHVYADANASHSHDDGKTPHHEHDRDGDPIPVSTHVVTWQARTCSCASTEIAPLLAVPAFIAPTDAILGTLLTIFQKRGHEFRLPTSPAPGSALPLLI
jgi:hypothetical protein